MQKNWKIVSILVIDEFVIFINQKCCLSNGKAPRRYQISTEEWLSQTQWAVSILESKVVYLAASRKINQPQFASIGDTRRLLLFLQIQMSLISLLFCVAAQCGRVCVCARSPKAKISVGPDSEKCILCWRNASERVSLRLHQTDRRLSRFSNCTHSEREPRERENYLFLQMS